jgi:hypothetical protein
MPATPEAWHGDKGIDADDADAVTGMELWWPALGTSQAAAVVVPLVPAVPATAVPAGPSLAEIALAVPAVQAVPALPQGVPSNPEECQQLLKPALGPAGPALPVVPETLDLPASQSRSAENHLGYTTNIEQQMRKHNKILKHNPC